MLDFTADQAAQIFSQIDRRHEKLAIVSLS